MAVVIAESLAKYLGDNSKTKRTKESLRLHPRRNNQSMDGM